jgi:prephenate dehydrogenase
VKKNPGASLVDLGDGVLAVEFHSKMNAIGSDTIQMLQTGVREAERNFAALVVGNEATHFSAGANLMLVLLEAQEENWDELDLIVRTFQQTTMALRYADVPVVVAPAGLALGGGCEIALHADRVQAAGETYLGLVEVGVGLIPAGGGTKEMVARAAEQMLPGSTDFLPTIQRAFETIGFARTAASGPDAMRLGYLRPVDAVMMNRERLISDAKIRALQRVREGYQAPPRRTAVAVGGEPVAATLKLGVHLAWRAGRISDPATRAVARTAAALAAVEARWQVAGTAPEAVAGADLVVVAVPLPAVGPVFDQLTRSGYQGLVTDVTSVKGEVARLASNHLGPGIDFVGGHPMAGSESSGFSASDAGLFRDCSWVLCLEPRDESRLPTWLELAAMLLALGARVVPSTAAHHDTAVASVSHVPHLFATALVSVSAADPLALALGAGSFRDGTRVAATRPDLVAAMCGGNAEAVRLALDTALAALAGARRALAGPDPTVALRAWCEEGYRIRSRWPVLGAPPVVVPATVDELSRLGSDGGWITAVAPDRATVTASRPLAMDARPGQGESRAGR